MNRHKSSPGDGNTMGRRDFLKRSLAAPVAASAGFSFAENTLLARGANAPIRTSTPGPGPGVPLGRIGKVNISRLICGGNLISGYAHSRDLIYVSALLKNYFTDERIMETWERCEEQGINTMIAYPGDPRAIEVYRRYVRERGGEIQYLAQISPPENDLRTPVRQAADTGAVGAFLVGNAGDLWTREGKVALIGKLISIVKEEGLIAGVAGHELRTVLSVEQAGAEPDFYMKTLHSTGYWSKRQPDQHKEIIDNYDVDNYWCLDPAETIRAMAKINRPWIAYKVLAAGAIHPKDGFRFAFENGADFAAVGMFDFQVAEDAVLAARILRGQLERKRPWMTGAV